MKALRLVPNFAHITTEGWHWLKQDPARMQAFAMTSISIGEWVVEKLERIEKIGKGIEEKKEQRVSTYT